MKRIQFARFIGLIFMLLAVSLMSVVLVGCPPQNIEIKSLDEMSPKEKATFMMSMYNKQYENYKQVAANPDLTEAQRTILRKKKSILTEVYPLIELYVSYVDSGAIPSAETEKQIITYLDEIAKLVPEE